MRKYTENFLKRTIITEVIRATNTLHIFPSTKKQARVFFHIVTDDDGSKPAANLKDVSNELDSMGVDYSPGNICFDSVGLNYVASTYINGNIIIDADPAHQQRANDSLDRYYVPGCLNIFYVSEIGGVNQNSGSPGHGQGCCILRDHAFYL